MTRKMSLFVAVLWLAFFLIGIPLIISRFYPDLGKPEPIPPMRITKMTDVAGCEILKVEHYDREIRWTPPLFVAKCGETATVSYQTGGKVKTDVFTIATSNK